MGATRSVSPSVYKIRHGLQSVNGAESQIDDVTKWWSQVFSSDRAKAKYEQSSGNVDDSFVPPPVEAINHFGFRWAGLLLAQELTRQSEIADRWRSHHHAEARRLRAAAAMTDDDEKAAKLEAEAAKHDGWARLALAWYDAAAFAAREGEDLVATYDEKFADLNAAVAAAHGDRAESKEYAA
jgi:hypothetical protein